MTDTYPKINKINEAAAELIKQLEDYKNNIYREISYAAYCEIGTEADYWGHRGYEGQEAIDKASDELARYHEENGYDNTYEEELKTIDEALKALGKLTIKENG
jgi:tagatose-1,6-bisphosphate aldolase